MSDNFYIHRPGLGNVGSYQVSGMPFVTGSGSLLGYDKVSFPYVTKRISIHTVTTSHKIYFTDPATTNANEKGHYVTISSNVIFSQNVKCKEIYISGSSSSAGTWQIFAELTNISTDQMFTLTGSGLTD